MRRILFLFVLCGLVTVSQASPELSAASLRPDLFAENVISTGDDESHPAFTPDGKTLYFLKNDPSFNHWTIVVSHEQNGKWSTPEVALFSGQFSDADPFITVDGQRFFFISTRPVNGKWKEDTDIWMMKKSGDSAAVSTKWSEPEYLSAVNSDASEWFPTVSKNGNLYFGSERPGGKGKCDLYVSRLVDGKYQPPENLGEPINTAANEVEPFIAPDESYIIFAGTGLPESRGAYDLYVSFRRDGIWTKPVNLGDKINSAAWDFSPKVSPDGKWFFFTSNRGFADKPLEKRLSYKELLQKLHSPGNGLRDIYKIDISALNLASSGGARAATQDMNAVAERYAHLVLAVGQHDPDYVDAFYGPAEWKTQAEKEKKSLDAIGTEAAELIATLAKTPDAAASGDEILKLRREYLQKQISALAARARMLKGEKFKFDDESRALYDAVAPTFPDSHFDDIIAQLEKKIPGTGPLWQRYEKWRKPFVIPKEKLGAVFKLAIKECRARTLAHVALPPNESFTVEYVTNKPWGGYNWYKGNFHSVIQVNTDLPIYIDSAVDLAAHEGYPGHHVYNSLLEKNLVRDRGWTEFSVYPLFSPQSLVAEGTANFGRDIAFPTKTERVNFEKEVLFPAAGIDSKRADEYYAVQDLMKQLDYAVNEAARRLVNGEIDEKAAAQFLQKYAVMEPARAEKRVKFIQRNGSYVINYNLGEDMVRRYIEKRGGTDPGKRWSEFGKLLSSPRLPSGLQ